MSTKRDRLNGRKRPTATYQLRIDHADAAAADKQILEARAELPMAILGGRDQEFIDRIRDRIVAAEAALLAACEAIDFLALPPEEFEALLELPEHKPREGTDDEAWNTRTFPRACFLACVSADVMPLEEWEAFIKKNVNDGEQVILYNTAINANIRVLDDTVPKDSTPTLS